MMKYNVGFDEDGNELGENSEEDTEDKKDDIENIEGKTEDEKNSEENKDENSEENKKDENSEEEANEDVESEAAKAEEKFSKIKENTDKDVAEHDIVRFVAYVFSDTLPQSSFEKKYSKDKDEYIQLVVRRSAMLGVCGAFYKRELFFDNNIRFQQGIRTGEDWMVLFELLIKAKSFIYIEKDYYGYRVNESSVTRRLVSAVRPDALIALNHIIAYAKTNAYYVSSRDIAIARSDLRRGMMKEAILNKDKAFFLDTDEALKKYASQRFWADVFYSKRLKHKMGFFLYWLLDRLYRLKR